MTTNRFDARFGAPALLLAGLTLTALAGCGGGDGAASEETAAGDVASQPAGAAATDEHAGHDHAAEEPTPATPALATSDGPPGKIEVDNRLHDFGARVEGEVLSHTFKMKNIGEGPLLIAQAKPTCGCTVGRVQVQDESGEWMAYEMNTPIPPGADFEIEARLNTRNKKNLAHSKINVFSNDPRGVVTVELKATLSTYFTTTPGNINFDEVSVSDTRSGSVTVSGKGGEPFLLTVEDRPVPEGLSVELEPVDPNDEGKAAVWKVNVALGAGAREGRIGYPINLISDRVIDGAPVQADGSDTVYTTTVMVNALVKGLISHNPQYLSFGLVRPGYTQTRSLRIENNDPNFTFPPAKVRITQAGSDEESPFAQYFSHVVRPSSDGNALDVELTLNGMPDDMNGSFQGKLVVETQHPSKPEVEVLFSGVCRGGLPTAAPNTQRKAGPGQAADQKGE